MERILEEFSHSLDQWLDDVESGDGESEGSHTPDSEALSPHSIAVLRHRYHAFTTEMKEAFAAGQRVISEQSHTIEGLNSLLTEAEDLLEVMKRRLERQSAQRIVHSPLDEVEVPAEMEARRIALRQKYANDPLVLQVLQDFEAVSLSLSATQAKLLEERRTHLEEDEHWGEKFSEMIARMELTERKSGRSSLTAYRQRHAALQ